MAAEIWEEDTSIVAPPHPPLTAAQRAQLFGAFAWAPAPLAGNPEAIVIAGNWVLRHIVNVALPLEHLKVHSTRFHRAGAHQLLDLFAAWGHAGLLTKILSWDGAFVARLKRGHVGGGAEDLSSHCWGTAFDINARWNPLGHTPAAIGAPGSVRELVSLAREFGFYWGGDFKSRVDGMHFELCSVLPVQPSSNRT